MKNFLISMLAVLALSCTNDYAREDSESNFKKKDANSKKNAGLNPENTANAYDIAGKIHNDLLDAYLSGNFSDQTISAISSKIDSISLLNSDLQNLPSYYPINFQEIQGIVDSPEMQLEQIIANSWMSTGSKNCLSEFMSLAALWQNSGYDAAYQSIISFEAAVANNQQFSAEEKRIILTSSAITRYSLYYASERKDKDWETSVGNRVGAVQGALSNSATAVTRSLLAGILSSNTTE
ncbi:hypothetical protein NJT12_07880 [Flavobacterium sp. AC]|uniref:Uncharacterized protein n=1 Tax=Flavobacterium azizsancarii TaxID=2961580 RepID=A0ABT4WBQ8_9FLAO|nr:hypothetical protein [Flavobacterium azizsancarii]MDA6069534.1 hypothetical protein [Flavobacterium azizsancarii]